MWTTQDLQESRSKHVLKNSADAARQLAAFKAATPISSRNSASFGNTPPSKAGLASPRRQS
jgi:hypothetical protein